MSFGLLVVVGNVYGNGIEGSVLVVPECRSVDSVGAAFGGDGNLAGWPNSALFNTPSAANLRDRFAGREGVADGDYYRL